MEDLYTFETPGPLSVAPARLTPVTLSAKEPAQRLVTLDGPDLRFVDRGWYEVLLSVDWDTANDDGHRFSHTAIPDHHPLHSEAIAAAVLNHLSDGTQLLRGNTVFEPDDGAGAIRLEVWQDSGRQLTVTYAALQLRRLPEG